MAEDDSLVREQMKGWCYVISNPDIKDKVKIGWTERTPEARARELYTTGVPTEYQIEYAAEIAVADAAEKHAHMILRSVRENASREWFRCSVKDAIAVVREAAQRFGLLNERFVGIEREEAQALQQRHAKERDAALDAEIQAARTAAQIRAAADAYEVWRQQQKKDCDALYSIKIKDSLTTLSYAKAVAISCVAMLLILALVGVKESFTAAVFFGFIIGTVAWFVGDGRKTPLTFQLEKDSALWSAAISERSAYICGKCGGFSNLPSATSTAVKCDRCHEWQTIPHKPA